MVVFAYEARVGRSSSILPVDGLRRGLCKIGPCPGFPVNALLVFFPCRNGKCLASSLALERWPKTAMRRSKDTSISPNRMQSSIHKVAFLIRIQWSFRLRNVPFCESASCTQTRPSSASSIRACTRDTVECSRTSAQDVSRPHVLVFILLFPATGHLPLTHLH
jgi:hypothetical protein